MPTVLIGGGSGLIGTRLSQLLTEKEYTVWHLSRTPDPNATYPTYHWDAKKQEVDQSAVDGADFIINLAGAGIADRLWTERRKKIIIDSRVNTTRLLQDAIERSAQPPNAFLSSSAIGYYGDRKDQLLTEKDAAGSGFLSESCMAWEEAVSGVADLGIRTVIVRTGIVMSIRGGALPKIVLPLHFFVGAYFGNGRQWMSWIHIDDVCRIFIHALEQEQLSGVFNAVAPIPERNKDFIAKTAEARDKPAVLLPVPEFALKLVLGEMSHTVLDSARVSAEKIVGAGFTFNFPKLPEALSDVFRRGI